MDKVIIDEIDVSECKYCASGYFCNKPMSKKYCSENTDCDYKQLQRLKAENEELKKELEKHKSKIGHLLSPLTDSDFQDKLQELEQENERLKEENIKFTLDTKKLIEQYSERVDKYSQALQEIRDIAEKMYYTNDEDTERDLHIELQDKINEVVGGVDET